MLVKQSKKSMIAKLLLHHMNYEHEHHHFKIGRSVKYKIHKQINVIEALLRSMNIDNFFLSPRITNLNET